MMMCSENHQNAWLAFVALVWAMFTVGEVVAQDPYADVLALGEQLVRETNTHELARQYVGNDLTCTSCHLDAGRDEKAATFIGTATAYPAWSPREQRVITLEDRALNCFMRSMNGTRPPKGSHASIAITTYIASLSHGMKLRVNRERPLGPNRLQPIDAKQADYDVERGASLYTTHCADCHAVNGLGTDEGPPVWGDRSYNDGAGLSRNGKLASWLIVAMPLGDPNLSAEEAAAIAAYVNSHDRPSFRLEDHLPKPERLGEYNGAAATAASPTEPEP